MKVHDAVFMRSNQIAYDKHAAKAASLFALRCLPKCLEIAADGKKNKAECLKNLLQLQYSIYELDEYGESNWRIDTQKLDEIWHRIKGSWLAVPGSRGWRPPLTEIENYQRIEIDMRVGVRPDMIPIKEFYESKTCDVRLMRQLIWNAYQAPNSSVRRLWEIFDLIGEVLDDLTDVAEDRLAYNGNRFAFCIRQHGTNKTIWQYELLIALLAREFRRIVTENSDLVISVSFLDGKLADLCGEVGTRLQDCRRSQVEDRTL
ncbi:MAG: hypothetical protein V7609_2663 [Verrucomicrobiota bacterium]